MFLTFSSSFKFFALSSVCGKVLVLELIWKNKQCLLHCYYIYCITIFIFFYFWIFLWSIHVAVFNKIYITMKIIFVILLLTLRHFSPKNFYINKQILHCFEKKKKKTLTCGILIFNGKNQTLSDNTCVTDYCNNQRTIDTILRLSFAFKSGTGGAYKVNVHIFRNTSNF